VGKDVLFQVLQAAERIKLGLPQLANEIEVMRKTTLKPIEAQYLARLMGLDLTKGKTGLVNVNETGLLNVRRSGDKSLDAFTVMNVIQENALRGSYRYTVERPVLKGLTNGQTEYRTMKGRAIRSIDKTSHVNRFLWDKTLDLIGA
jgi:hypothetical protein